MLLGCRVSSVNSFACEMVFIISVVGFLEAQLIFGARLCIDITIWVHKRLLSIS